MLQQENVTFVEEVQVIQRVLDCHSSQDGMHLEIAFRLGYLIAVGTLLVFQSAPRQYPSGALAQSTQMSRLGSVEREFFGERQLGHRQEASERGCPPVSSLASHAGQWGLHVTYGRQGS